MGNLLERRALICPKSKLAKIADSVNSGIFLTGNEASQAMLIMGTNNMSRLDVCGGLYPVSC